jgi:hypothetical protein
MSKTDDNEKMAAESRPQKPAPAAPARKKSDLPDKIPDFPGDGSQGDPA